MERRERFARTILNGFEAYFAEFQNITLAAKSWFENAENDCVFMHCLPVRRGVTVTDGILDGPRSIVIPEARNRMLVQMAVLHRMLSGT